MTANAWIAIACFVLLNVVGIAIAAGKVLAKMDMFDKRFTKGDERMDGLQAGHDVHEVRLTRIELARQLCPVCQQRSTKESN